MDKKVLSGVVAILSILLSASLVSAATTHYVSTTGADIGDCSVPSCKTIQYAIGQAGSGDTINVADGIYTISFPITIQGKSYLSIVGNSGNPAAVTVTTTDVTWQANIFNLVNSNHITIDGMKLIINTKQGDPIILTHDPALGVVSGSNYNTIRNVITNGGWEGIRIENSNHNTIRDSVFEEAWHGIFIQGHSWGSTVGSDDNVIENNIIRKNYGELSGSGLTTSKGILVLGSAGTVIRNNMIQGGPGPSENLLTLNCIGVFASIDNTIEGNTFENCKIGMTVAGKAGYGITIDRESTFTSFKHNNIVGNFLYGVESFLTTVLNAEQNWWGSQTGPGTVGPGSGDKVSANVDYDPWLCEPYPTDWVSFNGKCIRPSVPTLSPILMISLLAMLAAIGAIRIKV
jgi:hypothetical protein